MADPNSRLINRFWSKVNKTADCWEWTACLGRGGYGLFGLDRRMKMAHRVAYTWLRGAIPDGLTIDHLCRNRKCVNPDHLEVVTGAENTRRGFGPTGINRRKTHCIRGHELSGHNLVIVRRGRECRACKQFLAARYYRSVTLK